MPFIRYQQKLNNSKTCKDRCTVYELLLNVYISSISILVLFVKVLSKLLFNKTENYEDSGTTINQISICSDYTNHQFIVLKVALKVHAIQRDNNTVAMTIVLLPHTHILLT